MQLVKIGRRELLQKALGFLERARTLAPERVDVWERVFMVSLVNGNRDLARQSSIFIFRRRQSTDDVSGAEQVFQAYLRVYPDSPEILDQFTKFYRQTKQEERGVAWLFEMVRMAETEEAYERAKTLLERILHADPDNTEARERLLRIHERQGLKEKIAEESLTLAESLCSQGNPQAAADLLLRARESAGEDWRILERIADALIRAERIESACEIYLRLGRMSLKEANLQPKGRAWLERARSFAPENSEIRDALAETYSASNDTAAAMALYRGILDQVGPESSPQAQIDICGKMTRLDPGDVDASLRLIGLLLSTGRCDEGIREIRRVYEQKGNEVARERLIDLLLRAIESHPYEMDLWEHLSENLSAVGRGAEAESVLLRAASTFRIEGKLPEAARLARLAIQVSQESIRAHETLAGVLQDAGSHGEALAEFYAVASRLRVTGQKERAGSFLERCVELAGDRIPYYEDLIRLSREMGDREAAGRWERKLISDLESDEGPERLALWLNKVLAADPFRTDLSRRLVQEVSLRDSGELLSSAIRDHLDRVEEHTPSELDAELERFLATPAYAGQSLEWGLAWAQRTANQDAEKRILLHTATEKEIASQWGEAKELFEKVLDLDPRELDAARGVCRVLEAAQDPALGSSLLRMAGLLSGSGDDREAIKYYRHAFAESEPGSDVLLSLIEALVRVGNREEAVVECQRWIDVAVKRGDTQQADMLYEKARSIDPENTHLLRDRSRFLERCGFTERAIEAYREVGDLYRKKDLADRAIESFRRAKFLDAENPEIIDHLIDLFMSENMLRAAARELADLRNLYQARGDIERAEEAAKRLREIEESSGEKATAEPPSRPVESLSRQEEAVGTEAPESVGDEVYRQEIAELIRIAEEKAEAGQTEEAVKAFRDAAGRWQDANQPEEAVRVLRIAHHLAEGQKDLVDELVDLEGRLGHRGAALEILQQTAEKAQRDGDYEQAAERYGRMLDLGCVNLAVRTGLAWSLAKAGKGMEAAKEFCAYARLLQDKELPEESLGAYRQAINLNPEGIEARREMASLLRQLGRVEEARTETLETARVLAAGQRYEEALQTLREVLKEDPRNVEARERIIAVYSNMHQHQEVLRERKVLAQVYAERGERLKAIAQYEEILELGEQDAMIYLILAEEARRAGNRERARHLYVALADLYTGQEVWSKAASCLLQVVQMDPQDVATRQRLAETYFRDGLRDKAVMEYLRIAEEALRHGDENLAIEQYERIRRIDPQNVRILGKIADCHIRRKDAVQAVEVCLELARIYRERGILSKSIEILRRTAQHFPRETRLLEDLAQLYLSRNLKDQALATFRDLVKIQPGNTTFQERLRELETELGFGRKEIPRPAEGPRKRIEPHPTSVREEGSESAIETERVAEIAQTMSGTLSVARRAFQKGRYLKAMDPLKEIIATTSSAEDYSLFVQAHSLLAECYLRLKRPKEAVRLLMQALTGGVGRDKESLELRYLLGVSLEKDGQREQAVLVYKKVHEIDPAYRDVKAKILWARTLQPRGREVPR